MRHIAVLLVCGLLPLVLQAKKDIWPFACIVHNADVIVLGKITAVRANSVMVNVEETVYGDCDSLISVSKWKEWTCDMRFAPYRKGQQLLLFLMRGKSLYYTINASTGELPVENDSILVYRENVRFALKELIQAIREVRDCFTVTSIYSPAFSDKPSVLELERHCPERGTPDPESIPRARVWIFRQSLPYWKKGM